MICFVANEQIGGMPFANVICQEEEERLLLMKDEVNPLREISPTSQLSQSSEEPNNPPSVKDIRRDEPMLGF